MISNFFKIILSEKFLCYFRKEKIHILFPYVNTLFGFIRIFGITTSNAERSFSKMKLIKSDLRSSMNDEQFNDLIFISSSFDMAEKLDFLELVRTFKEKSRKMSFIYYNINYNNIIFWD